MIGARDNVTEPGGMADGTRKKISCQRCQLRKIKCTRTYPCSSCTLVGLECHFRGDDSKRRPVGRNYVVALEGQVAHYESLLRRAKAASGDERNELLDSMLFDDHLASPQKGRTNEQAIDTRGSSRMSTTSLQTSLQGDLLFHGPTSMYQIDMPITPDHPPPPGSNDAAGALREWQGLAMPQNLRVKDEVLNKALVLFSLYQYPQYLFIHLEAFLEDYRKDFHRGKYWSYPLLYAICALGARISTDPSVKEKADVLSHFAETIVIAQALGRPHITVVQTLLCLAFYELGSGNHSKGWSLAGIAFRMGQDLGLHQDAKFMVSQDATIASEQDLMIRRRAYYGLYISDKIISLYLGRPVMLYDAEASVDLPKEIANSSSHSTWFELVEFHSSELGHIGSVDLMPAFPALIELSNIVEEVLFKVFSTKMVKKPRRELVLYRSARLEELSVRLGRWYSALPVDLTWNQWNPNPGILKPHVLVLNLLYHSTLISLNRHFVRPTPGFAESISSKEICISSADSIVALIRLFRSQHGLARSPVLLIYSAVVAGSGILYTQNPAALALEKDRRLSFILKSLAECSETHPLANEGRVKLQANIDGRRSSAVKERVTDSSSPTGLEGYPVSAAANMFDFNSYDPTFDFSVFDSPDLSISGAIGESLLPMSTGFTQAPDPAQTWSYGEASGDQNAPTSYIFDDPMLGFSPQDFDDTR